MNNKSKPDVSKLKKAASENGGDSGLQSDASSVRSSSLVSSCSSGLEELLADEEAEKAGSMTDWEKESRRRAREEIKDRLGEAGSLRSLNDHRLLLVLEMLEGRGLVEERDSLLAFVSTKEALLRVKNTCEQLERSILA